MTAHRERLAQLRERAATERPESWRPEPGETLAGMLVRYETGHTDYGHQHIAIVRDEDGCERALWLLQAVLLDEFKKCRPAPGDLIAVHYIGRRTSGDGRPYAAWRVVVDRANPAPPDWAAIDAEASERAAAEQQEDEDAPPF